MCEAFKRDTGQGGDIEVSTQNTDVDFPSVLTTVFSLQGQNRVCLGKKKGNSRLSFLG